jgi:tRNA G18 (ribose-2'-O)-methylase SpoU
VAWQHFPSAVEAMGQLKANGYEPWAVEQVKGSIPLQQLERKAGEPIALVFGNEVEGVQPSVLELCAGSIEIPQLGMKHSLNVSVAAGIVLWELVRNGI